MGLTKQESLLHEAANMVQVLQVEVDHLDAFVVTPEGREAYDALKMATARLMQVYDKLIALARRRT